ncbi:MAG: DUF4837 family protein [Longimicrobiales bacterium]|nr:DUF4837 family protein [Longimicrobiales bacterium]
MNRLARFGALSLLIPMIQGCGDKVGAWGDANSIVAVADPALWAEVEDQVYAALEPTVFTVTQEKSFTVTYTEPGDEIWGNMRKFRQMLFIGPASNRWVAEALEEADDVDELTPPQIVQIRNVWARNQLVTLLVVPEDDPVAGVEARLDDLAALFDEQYRRWARQRMFVSGADTALTDTLMTQFGFSLTLPQVYEWNRSDSVFIFRNDNPDPSELIRQIAVTWRTAGSAPVEFQTDSILAWRAALAEAHYTYPQEINLNGGRAGPIRRGSTELLEIQGSWMNPPDSGWPAGGPFILRSLVCPDQDRVYLIDAWLYAPGKEKYEYMIQLQTILESFRCEGMA